MIKNITQSSITLRLPVLIFLSMIGSVSLVSLLNYQQFKDYVVASQSEKSVTVSQNAEAQISSWLDELSEEVSALADDRSTVQALEAFSSEIEDFGHAGMNGIRSTYIDNNPFDLGERAEFTQTFMPTSYDRTHTEFHRQLYNVNERAGYYDLFLIHPGGNVAYTVHKEDDYGTNLIDGPYSDSGLGEAFNLAMASTSAEVVFVDFKPYAPSANVAASFLAKRVVSPDGELIGVVAIQLPARAIVDALYLSSNVSDEDEIYLVGSDGRLRSNVRHRDDMSILDLAPDMPHAKTGLTGDAVHSSDGVGIQGRRVISHTIDFEVYGGTWAVVVELDHAAAFAPLQSFKQRLILLIIAGAALSLLVGVLVARSITTPIKDFATSMKKVSEDDYEADVSGVDRKDELGQLSRTLEVFRDKLSASKQANLTELQNREEQARIVNELGEALKNLADGNLSVQLRDPFSVEYESLRTDFNSSVNTMNGLIGSIAENANEIRGRAEEINASSDELSQRTENQAATLEETAAALDELTASVRSAAESASEVEGVVSNARHSAKEGGDIVTEAVEAMSLIKKSSTEISQIIGVIDDIAFQTNLLSLNAGVEAARAGDAGRGFAVVASEVRALAQRSSEAAQQIKELITSSTAQVETGVGLVARTGEALGTIIDGVGNIDDLVAGMAAGSREQSVGLGEINTGMSHLDQVTQQNAAMVEEATAAAMTLKNESASLNQLVSRFKLDEAAQSTQSFPDPDIVSFKRALEVSDDVEDLPAKFAKEQVPAEVNASKWQDF